MSLRYFHFCGNATSSLGLVSFSTTKSQGGETAGLYSAGACFFQPGWSKHFPCLQEEDVRIAFLGEGEVDPVGGQVDVFVVAVEGDVVAGLVGDAFEVGVAAAQPAGGGAGVGFEDDIDAVFEFQPVHDDIELQDAHGAEDEVVGGQRPEDLGGAFFGQLV